MNRRPVTDVLAEHAPRLLSVAGVVAVYESRLADGQPCIKVGVLRDTPEIRAALPDRLDGYPVVIIETGEIAPRAGDDR